jgi:hypothetical protein
VLDVLVACPQEIITTCAAIIPDKGYYVEESLQRLSDAYEHLSRQETRATDAKRPSTRTRVREILMEFAYSYKTVTL